MQAMPAVAEVDANIKGVSDKFPDALFATGTERGQYYFVQRSTREAASPDSSLYFDYLMELAREHEGRYNKREKFSVRVKLRVPPGKKGGAVVPPQQFLDIHRDNAVYLVDTNVAGLIWKYDGLGPDFMEAVQKLNPFLDLPAAVIIGAEWMGIRRAEGGIFYDAVKNGWLIDAIEKTVSGESEHLRYSGNPFRRRAHLVIDNTWRWHEAVISPGTFVRLEERIPHLRRVEIQV